MDVVWTIGVPGDQGVADDVLRDEVDGAADGRRVRVRVERSCCRVDVKILGPGMGRAVRVQRRGEGERRVEGDCQCVWEVQGTRERGEVGGGVAQPGQE